MAQHPPQLFHVGQRVIVRYQDGNLEDGDLAATILRAPAAWRLGATFGVPYSGVSVWMYRVGWRDGPHHSRWQTFWEEKYRRECPLWEWETVGCDLGEPDLPL